MVTLVAGYAAAGRYVITLPLLVTLVYAATYYVIMLRRCYAINIAAIIAITLVMVGDWLLFHYISSLVYWLVITRSHGHVSCQPLPLRYYCISY